MKALAYTALFAVLFSVYSRLHVCINYLINQKYYAEVLCENKDKEDEEESCCHGKCAVQKELSELDKKEESQPGKTQAPVLKLAKADEALLSGYRFFAFRPAMGGINTPFHGKPLHGSLPVLLRPPAA